MVLIPFFLTIFPLLDAVDIPPPVLRLLGTVLSRCGRPVQPRVHGHAGELREPGDQAEATRQDIYSIDIIFRQNYWN